jgi:hypothetical protein
LSIVACFGLGGWNVADQFEQAPVVEPVHSFQGGELNGFQTAPWSAAPDHLGLVEAVDGLGQGVRPLPGGHLDQPRLVLLGRRDPEG